MDRQCFVEGVHRQDGTIRLKIRLVRSKKSNNPLRNLATLAQLAEHRFCKAAVLGSTPRGSLVGTWCADLHKELEMRKGLAAFAVVCFLFMSGSAGAAPARGTCTGSSCSLIPSASYSTAPAGASCASCSAGAASRSVSCSAPAGAARRGLFPRLRAFFSRR